MPIIIKRQSEELAFRVYVTDALNLIAKNTSGMNRDGGYLKNRYIDLITPEKVETRTPEEIIDQVIGKLNKIGGGENKPI